MKLERGVRFEFVRKGKADELWHTENMTNNSESNTSDVSSGAAQSRGGMLKLGAIAVGSALLGGIAAAWWYRKTIQKLHESGENSNNPHFGIDSDHVSEETAKEL